jgi:mycothiol synthase
VWRLSNLLSHHDAGDSVPVRFHPARPEQQADALSIVLAQNGALATAQQVGEFLAFTQSRSINLDDLWVAERNESIVWAMMPVVSPGRTMLILAPDGVLAPPNCAGDMIDHVCTQFQARDVQLAQVLLNPEDVASHELYRSRAFVPMAELIYLFRQFRKPVPAPMLSPEYSLQTYSKQSHGRFARVISRTYERSLDCPALNGKRSIDDVLAGHKATGVFDASLWFVVSRDENDLAVLLLSRTSDGDGVELVYLGISPEARGQGLGDFLMEWAAHQTTRLERSRLTLAVDSTNAPAMRLYFRHGMQRLASKLALMREL